MVYQVFPDRFANGDPSIPKEYFEVFGGGRTAIMTNFREVALAQGKKTKVEKFGGDKGHAEEMRRTLAAMQSGTPMPISFESLHDTTLATFAAMESLSTGEVIKL